MAGSALALQSNRGECTRLLVESEQEHFQLGHWHGTPIRLRFSPGETPGKENKDGRVFGHE